MVAHRLALVAIALLALAGCATMPAAHPLPAAVTATVDTVTLACTLPARPAAYVGPWLMCTPSPYAIPSRVDSLIAHVYPRVLCSPWAAGYPEWPACWKRVERRIAYYVRGLDGQPYTFSFTKPAGEIDVIEVTTKTATSPDACGSNPVIVGVP